MWNVPHECTSRRVNTGIRLALYVRRVPDPFMPFQEELHTFHPISLVEMDGVALLDRIDTKFVFGAALLPAVLDALRPEYRVLDVNGKRGADYRTLYYDTADLRHFRDHHRSKELRCKVRYREYMGSDLCFLEVKRKTAKGRTDKLRMRVASIPEQMPGDHHRFVQKASEVQEVVFPQVWNMFHRLTFVHRRRAERVTIDSHVRFERSGRHAALGPACIAELKQAPGDTGSPFGGLMRALGQAPTSMSKYCVGVWKLVPELEYDRFLASFHASMKQYGTVEPVPDPLRGGSDPGPTVQRTF